MILLALALILGAFPMSAMAASRKTVYVSSTGSGTLNLRAGPGKDYDVKGYVHHGDKVSKLKTSGEWSKVKTKSSKVGWIKTKYIDGTTRELGTGYKYVSTSGGSVNLTAGALAGSGAIQANGGNNGLYGPGSGGRSRRRNAGQGSDARTYPSHRLQGRRRRQGKPADSGDGGDEDGKPDLRPLQRNGTVNQRHPGTADEPG